MTIAKLQRTYLIVPYEDREQAKASGAKWDGENNAWYVDRDADASLEDVEQWLAVEVPQDIVRAKEYGYYTFERNDAGHYRAFYHPFLPILCAGGSLLVYRYKHVCWKCKEDTFYYRLALKDVSVAFDWAEDMMQGIPEKERSPINWIKRSGDNITFLQFLKHLPKVVEQKLESGFPSLSKSFNKTVGSDVYMNHCTKCGVKQAGFFEPEEPMEGKVQSMVLFNPLPANTGFWAEIMGTTMMPPDQYRVLEACGMMRPEVAQELSEVEASGEGEMVYLNYPDSEGMLQRHVSRFSEHERPVQDFVSNFIKFLGQAGRIGKEEGLPLPVNSFVSQIFPLGDTADLNSKFVRSLSNENRDFLKSNGIETEYLNSVSSISDRLLKGDAGFDIEASALACALYLVDQGIGREQFSLKEKIQFSAMVAEPKEGSGDERTFVIRIRA